MMIRCESAPRRELTPQRGSGCVCGGDETDPTTGDHRTLSGVDHTPRSKGAAFTAAAAVACTLDNRRIGLPRQTHALRRGHRLRYVTLQPRLPGLRGNPRPTSSHNKKHLKNVGPIRYCEPPHAACFTLPFTRCRYCRTPPAHRCPQQHQRQQRQRVTEGTAMAR